MESFQKMVAKYTDCLRDGTKVHDVPVEKLTIGDIVFLKSGDLIPADLRILEANSFKVDNSSLTGESEPQSRRPDFTH